MWRLLVLWIMALLENYECCLLNANAGHSSRITKVRRCHQTWHTLGLRLPDEASPDFPGGPDRVRIQSSATVATYRATWRLDGPGSHCSSHMSSLCIEWDAQAPHWLINRGPFFIPIGEHGLAACARRLTTE